MLTQSCDLRKYSCSDVSIQLGETRMTTSALSHLQPTLYAGRSGSAHFARSFNCLVLEPDESCRDVLRRAVAADRDLTLIGEARTASHGLMLAKQYTPDMLVLGVELLDSTGFDFLAMLRQTGIPMPEVIFVSHCDRHAIHAIDVCATGYLLKPLDEKKLAAALAFGKDRAAAKIGFRETVPPSEQPVAIMHPSRIVVKSAGRMVFLPPDRIDWIQAKGNYLTLHVGGEEYRIRESIQSMERKFSLLPFLRIHRSTMVNINRIREVERWYTGEYIVRLDRGKELTLSKTYRDQFFAATTPRAS